jgi:hypothetical protein
MSDKYNFCSPIEGKLDEYGRFVRLTWRERMWRALGEILWPRTPSYRVSAVDVESGTVVMERI